MVRVDHKELELKRFADIIQTSQNRKHMVQRLNGYRMGLTNKYGKKKRLGLWALLIREYS